MSVVILVAIVLLVSVILQFIFLHIKFLGLHRKLDRTATEAPNVAKEIWDARVADTVQKLTSEDTLAEALSRMSEPQIARLASKVQAIRKERTQ